jgi:hypothetical protein
LTSRPCCGLLRAMFWYVMLMLFSPLYLLFGLVFRGECVCQMAMGHL